jgi:cob(I)alamin adenosyltransferase
MLIVYTGAGKGKTTAAVGLMIRALGHGMKTALLQFIKGKWSPGEISFLGGLENADIRRYGLGMLSKSNNLEADLQAARAGWEETLDILNSGEFDLIVLDELTYLHRYGVLSEEELTAPLRRAADSVNVVVTGRYAPAKLLEAADLVTEMMNRKHPLEKGIHAQKGIEF